MDSGFIAQCLVVQHIIFTVSCLMGIIHCFFVAVATEQFFFSFHQVPIASGWTEAASNEKFDQHVYT